MTKYEEKGNSSAFRSNRVTARNASDEAASKKIASRKTLAMDTSVRTLPNAELLQKKAFTLIELMVVIAIIGVLLAVIAPQVFRQINKGKTAACEQFYAAVKTAATNYYLDNMSWPSTFYADSGNNDLMVTTGASTWDGPYLDRWPATNPWGGVLFL